MSDEHVQHRDDEPDGVVPDGVVPDGVVPDGGEPQAAAEAAEATQPAGDEPPAAETGAAEGTSEADETPEDDSSDGSSGDASDDSSPEAKSKKPKKRKKAEKPKPALKPPPPERLEGAIEALLLVAGDVLRLERLRDLLGLASVLPLREALDAIRERWDAAGVAFELEQVGGGVRVVTRPEYAEYVGRLGRRPASDKLSRALLETLCIVAYKQPVGRAEVERIRGVQAGEGLRQLLERSLLKVVGRSDQPGRPLLYGTTQKFLTSFGLDDLKDLPAPADLKRL